MEKLKSILINILFAGIGFALTYGVGYFVGVNANGENSIFEEANIFLLIIILIASVILSVYLQIIIHELGHLVFGLLTGYKFSSFRVGALTLKRNSQTNKLEIKKLTIAGTGGQCLMLPPKIIDGKYPVIWYNLGGPIFSLLGALPLLVVSYISNQYLGLAVSIFGIIGLLFALMNGVPFKSKFITNDGYNAIALYKNAQAREGLYNQLLINHQYMQGKKLAQMPSEWFEVPSSIDSNNHMVASMYVVKENRLFEEMKFDEVRKLIEEIKTNDIKLIGLHKVMLDIDLIIINLIQKGKDTNLSLLEDANLKSVMKSMKNHLSVQILNYALAVIKDEDKEKAEKLKENFIKSMKKSVYPAELEIGLELMEVIDKSVEKIEN